MNSRSTYEVAFFLPFVRKALESVEYIELHNLRALKTRPILQAQVQTLRRELSEARDCVLRERDALWVVCMSQKGPTEDTFYGVIDGNHRRIAHTFASTFHDSDCLPHGLGRGGPSDVTAVNMDRLLVPCHIIPLCVEENGTDLFFPLKMVLRKPPFSRINLLNLQEAIDQQLTSPLPEGASAWVERFSDAFWSRAGNLSRPLTKTKALAINRYWNSSRLQRLTILPPLRIPGPAGNLRRTSILDPKYRHHLLGVRNLVVAASDAAGRWRKCETQVGTRILLPFLRKASHLSPEDLLRRLVSIEHHISRGDFDQAKQLFTLPTPSPGPQTRPRRQTAAPGAAHDGPAPADRDRPSEPDATDADRPSDRAASAEDPAPMDADPPSDRAASAEAPVPMEADPPSERPAESDASLSDAVPPSEPPTPIGAAFPAHPADPSDNPVTDHAEVATDHALPANSPSHQDDIEETQPDTPEPTDAADDAANDERHANPGPPPAEEAGREHEDRRIRATDTNETPEDPETNNEVEPPETPADATDRVATPADDSREAERMDSPPTPPGDSRRDSRSDSQAASRALRRSPRATTTPNLRAETSLDGGNRDTPGQAGQPGSGRADSHDRILGICRSMRRWANQLSSEDIEGMNVLKLRDHLREVVDYVKNTKPSASE